MHGAGVRRNARSGTKTSGVAATPGAANETWYSRLAAALQAALFGFDFFISYRHADASNFARSLHASLEKKFDCFLDERHYEAGHNLPWMQSRALRRARKLLVVVSPRAHVAPATGTDWLLAEVLEFKHFARRRGVEPAIVPIGTADTLSAAAFPDSKLLREIPTPASNAICIFDDAVESDRDVGPAAIAKLESDFREVRRRGLRRTATWAAIIAIVCAIGLAVVSKGRESIALRVAEERLRTTRSQRLALESGRAPAARPEIALALAVASFETAPTLEARRALWSRLAALPQLERVWRRDQDTTYRSPEHSHVAWSWTGTALLATDRSGNVTGWSYPDGEILLEHRIDAVLSPQAIALGEDLLATLSGSLTGTLAVRAVAIPPHPGPVSLPPAVFEAEEDYLALDVHPDGRGVAAIKRDGVIDFVSADGSVTKSVQFKPGARALSYVNEGRHLIAVADDGGFAVLTMATGGIWPANRRAAHVQAPMASEGDGAFVVARLGEAQVYVGEIGRTGIKERKPIDVEQATALDIAAIDHRLAVGRIDGAVEIGELPDWQEPKVLKGSDASISAVAFSRDGRRLAVADSQDGLTVWRLDTANLLARPLRDATSGGALAMAIHPQGSEVATSLESGEIVILALDEEMKVRGSRVLATRDVPTFSLDYSPDGHALAAGGVDRFRGGTGTFEVFDLATGTPRFAPRQHRLEALAPRPVVGDVGTRVLFDDDATHLLTFGADGMTRRWDAHDGSLRQMSDSDGIHRATVDGRVLVRVRRAWGWSTNVLPAPTGPVEVAPGIAHPAISWDGRWTAAPGGSRSTVLEVRAVGRPEAEGTSLDDHAGPISAIAFQPSGQLLASGDETGEVRLWDLESMAIVASLRAASQIVDLSFTPDGTWLVVASRSGDITAWPVTARAWRARACEIIARIASTPRLFDGASEPTSLCDRPVAEF